MLRNCQALPIGRKHSPTTTAIFSHGASERATPIHSPKRRAQPLLSEPARQPRQASAAHRSLLAIAPNARPHPPHGGARPRRARLPQAARAQDRRPRRREGRPHLHLLHCALPGRRLSRRSPEESQQQAREFRGAMPLKAALVQPPNLATTNLKTRRQMMGSRASTHPQFVPLSSTNTTVKAFSYLRVIPRCRSSLRN